MPIYEYSCQKCGERVEAMQRVSDKPLKRHAKCGGRLEKEWSRTGFQFKGSGWYVTDYAGKKGESKEGKEATTEASESKTKATAVSETKTTKPDAKDAKTPSVKASGGDKK
jgi:putative FmdB family regulatory protein